jgi:hypothetical protein
MLFNVISNEFVLRDFSCKLGYILDRSELKCNSRDTVTCRPQIEIGLLVSETTHADWLKDTIFLSF